MKKFASCFVVILGVIIMLSACTKPKETANTPANKPDVRQKIGALFNINDLCSLASSLPDAEISYFTNYDDMIDAMSKGEIDAFVGPDYSVKAIINENESLTVSEKEIGTFDLAFAFKKDNDQDLANKFSAWFLPMKEEKHLEDIVSKWIDGPDAERYLPDFSQMTDMSGTIKLASVADDFPVSYMHNNQFHGISEDAAMHFCSGWRYRLETVSAKNMNTAAEMVKNGMADLAVYAVKNGDDIPSELSLTDPFHSSSVVIVKMKR